MPTKTPKFLNTIVEIKVTPKASRNCVKEEEGRPPLDLHRAVRLKVYVTAAPDKGKANSAVIELLAKYYGVNKSAITILQGETSSNKKIVVNR